MHIVRTLLVVCFLVLPTLDAAAAELVLFETEGCPWCEAWDRDVGTVYDLTDEARILTLRRVDLRDPMPADLRQIADIKYTPTFVVVDDGKEVGRIVGYIGQDQFWGLLGEIIKNLPRTESHQTNNGGDHDPTTLVGSVTGVRPGGTRPGRGTTGHL